MFQDDELVEHKELQQNEDVDDVIFEFLEPHLQPLLFKYDCYLRMENTPQHLELNAEFVGQFTSN